MQLHTQCSDAQNKPAEQDDTCAKLTDHWLKHAFVMVMVVKPVDMTPLRMIQDAGEQQGLNVLGTKHKGAP